MCPEPESALSATIKIVGRSNENSSSDETEKAALLEQALLEMAEYKLYLSHKTTFEDRPLFLQAEMISLKENHALFGELVRSDIRVVNGELQLNEAQLESLNSLADDLAKTVEATHNQHWTLTLLQRHYLKNIRAEKRILRAIPHAQPSMVEKVVDAREDYLGKMESLHSNVVKTLQALFQEASNQDKFAKSPEILAELLETSLIGNEKNIQTRIKRIIFQAINPDVLNHDTVTLSEKQANQLAFLTKTVMQIRETETSFNNTYTLLSAGEKTALELLGFKNKLAYEYITESVLRPLTNTTAALAHATRATAAAYQLVNRRRNMFDAVKNMTTLLNEADQVQENLTTSLIVQKTPSPQAETPTFLGAVAGYAGGALNAVGRVGKGAIGIAGAVYNAAEERLIKKSNSDDVKMIPGLENNAALSMAAFQRGMASLRLEDEAQKRQCLVLFIEHQKKASEYTTPFTWDEFEKNEAALSNAALQIALQLHEIKRKSNYLLNENELNEIFDALRALDQTINGLEGDVRIKEALKNKMRKILFHLHEKQLLPLLYENIDNSLNANKKIDNANTMNSVIANLSNQRRLPSAQQWNELAGNPALSGYAFFKAHSKLDHTQKDKSVKMDPTSVRTPLQSEKAAIEGTLRVGLSQIISSLYAHLDTEKRIARQLKERLPSEGAVSQAYQDRLTKKSVLCDRLLKELSNVDIHRKAPEIAEQLGRLLHGYTGNELYQKTKNTLTPSLNLPLRLLRASHQLSTVNAILASNGPLLAKGLEILFNQLNLTEAQSAFNDFYRSSSQPLPVEDELWLNEAFLDPLSIQTLSNIIIADTLTHSTQQLIQLVDDFRRENIGQLGSYLIKKLPNVFPGFKVASFVVRQAIKSQFFVDYLDSLQKRYGQSNPSEIAEKIVAYFTGRTTKQSNQHEQAFLVEIYFNEKQNDLNAKRAFAKLFFKLHRLCELGLTPENALALLTKGNLSLGDVTKERILALYNSTQSNEQNDSNLTQRLIEAPSAQLEPKHRVDLLFCLVERHLALAETKKNEGIAFDALQSHYQVVSQVIQGLNENLLNEDQKIQLRSLRQTFDQNINEAVRSVIQDVNQLKQTPVIKRQQEKVAEDSLASQFEKTRKNKSRFWFLIGMSGFNLYSIANFAYSMIVAPIFISPAATAAGYLGHLLGFASAGAGTLAMVLGWVSFVGLIACFAVRLGMEFYQNYEKFNAFANNKDPLALKILKIAGWTMVCIVSAAFKTAFSAFLIEKTVIGASWIFNKIKNAVLKKDREAELANFEKQLNELTIDKVGPEATKTMTELHDRIMAFKTALTTSKLQSEALKPLIDKVVALEARLASLKTMLETAPASSTQLIASTLDLSPSWIQAAETDSKEHPVTLSDVHQAKTRREIHAYELAKPPVRDVVQEPENTLTLKK